MGVRRFGYLYQQIRNLTIHTLHCGSLSFWLCVILFSSEHAKSATVAHYEHLIFSVCNA